MHRQNIIAVGLLVGASAFVVRQVVQPAGDHLVCSLRAQHD